MAHDTYSGRNDTRSLQPILRQPPQPAAAPSLRSRAENVLERILPAREAPAQPVEVNPFQQAIDGYDRVSRDLMLTRDTLASKERELAQAQHDIGGLKARAAQENDFFRAQMVKITAERDALSRICVELATTINAIGQASGTVINLTIKAQEIAQTYKEKFQEAAALNDVVEDMDVDIRETLRNAGVRLEDREAATGLPPNQLL
jgi:hypothetical protein